LNGRGSNGTGEIMDRRTRFWIRRLLMVVMLVLIGFALYQTGESEAVEVGGRPRISN